MTNIDLHNKYFSLISSKISLEHLEEYADKLDEDILLLIGCKDTSEEWVRKCEKIIAISVEFLNLAVHFSENGFVPQFALDVVARLVELKFSIAYRGLGDRPELEYIGEAIMTAGRGIIIQEEKYWLLPCEWFNLDPNGLLSSMLDEDLKNARRNEKEEASKEPQPSIEELSLNILFAISQSSSIITSSLVQRKGGVGYGRAAMIIDYMEDKKYIQTLKEAKNENSKFRRILLTKSQIKELLNERLHL